MAFLQQDLASCHISRKMSKFFEGSDLTVLDWPVNFPDISSMKPLTFPRGGTDDTALLHSKMRQHGALPQRWVTATLQVHAEHHIIVLTLELPSGKDCDSN